MDDRNDRIERALIASQRLRTSTIAGSEIVEVDGLVLCLSNLPDPSLNGAFLEREPVDPEGALEDASAASHARGHGFGVFLREGVHPGLGASIHRRSMRKLFADPAMVVSIGDLAITPIPEGVEFQDASSDDLSSIAQIDAEAFGTAIDVSRGLINEGLLKLPDLRIAQALLDGEPVGQAMAHAVDGTVGIFGVAVAERVRRRGIGAAVTAEVLRGSGADFAWLFARGEARSVYARLGFEPLSTWAVWVDR